MDAYGGPVANRLRFLLEVTETIIRVWGADKVGVRLSPHSAFNDMRDSNPAATFLGVARALSSLGLAYLHVIEGASGTELAPAHDQAILASQMREAFGGPLILNGGYTRLLADAAIGSGKADLVSFGTLFLANPDLPERFRLHAPLNRLDESSAYGGDVLGYSDHSRDAQGYTDYPFLATARARPTDGGPEGARR
jgi:N-ethylmaleimide reductase